MVSVHHRCAYIDPTPKRTSALVAPRAHQPRGHVHLATSLSCEWRQYHIITAAGIAAATQVLRRDGEHAIGWHGNPDPAVVRLSPFRDRRNQNLRLYSMGPFR